MLQYKRIGVTVKSGLDAKNEAVERVLAVLKDLEAEVLFDPKRVDQVECTEGMPCYESEQDIDILLVIGGDGTILRAIREMEEFSIPILSVNRGTVGFLAETNMDEVETILPALLQGEGIVEERSILFVKALRGNEVIYDGHALNEAVIAQGTIARLVDLKTTINDEPLTTYHADGLIISTPTGSTAYSLAAGGPIVHPESSSSILTPINPHSFSQKPIVIRGDSKVDVEVITRVTKFEDVEVYLTIDGQVSVALKRGDHVQTYMNHKMVKFLRRKEDTFFGTLREKLKWGDRVD